MRLQALALAVLAIASSTRGAEVVVDGRTFRVPDGYTVEKVAGPPLVDRPIVADFDEQGRLYVADSSGSNDPVKKQLEDRPHRIVRLEDLDGDGKFDRSTVFADRMMFPAGAMWLDGSLYVAAPPSIWKLTDLDGDGKADRREEWFQGKTLTGCANDLHGPYAGPDGRVYWCKGAFAPQTYERPGKALLRTRAAHIVRARRDGTEVEPVMTGGMDNPVDVAFTAEGERIFTTTFLQHPGGGRRDGLIHALYGGVYGKVHDVIDGHPRTGPDTLPPLVHLGPAAPSGLMRAESGALGQPDDLYAACFNLRKVTRHRLAPDGGSYAATTDDFLASDDLDFHPTDVQEDADGSLLVVDTGGWYKLCCPTSQLVKPDVLGAIYRVRKGNDRGFPDPRGLKIDWATLTPEAVVGLLSDDRHAVRRRAIEALGRIGDPAVRDLSDRIRFAEGHRTRINAIWAACRIDSPAARAACREGLKDKRAEVRQVAANAAGLWRDRGATTRLIASLGDEHPQVRRVAAEALGRIGDPSAVPALLRAAGDAKDWAFRHSATYAVIEIDDPAATRFGLSHPSPGVNRAALVAIDQMEGGGLTLEPLMRALITTDTDLRDAAWWVAAHHLEWGDGLAAFFRGRIASVGETPADLAELEARIGPVARSAPIRDLIGSELASSKRDDVRLAMLGAMARSGLKEMPEAWSGPVIRAIADPHLGRRAIATARSLTTPSARAGGLVASLLRIADDPSKPADLRLAALGAVPGGLPRIEPGTFAFLIEQVGPDRPAAARGAAADALSKARLTPEQSLGLAKALAQAGPIEVGRLLDAFDKADGEALGLQLVDSLQRSPARASLRLDTLKPRLSRFGPKVVEQASALYAAIEADTADRRGHLEGLLANLSGGDIRRGQAVFNGSKAACVTCHAIGYVGGKLGPDLTKIGQVRAERDLLESIAYPSASFVRSYEPVSVATREGRVFSGILREDAPDELVLAVAADKDERIPRDRIEEIAPGTVSVMPAGLDRQLTSGELADLIAFLRACR